MVAPLPVPTMMAVGVASPNAHGQEMTNTEMAMRNAYANVLPAMSHTTAAMSAMAKTDGTK